MIVRGRGSQTFVERNGKTETHPMVATEWAVSIFASVFLPGGLAFCHLQAVRSATLNTMPRTGLNPRCGAMVRNLNRPRRNSFRPRYSGRYSRAYSRRQRSLVFYRNVIAFDRLRQRMEIVSIVLTEEAEGSHARLRELYQEAVTRTEH